MFTYHVDDDIQLGFITGHEAETVYALVDKNRSRLRRYFDWVDNYHDVDDWREHIQREKMAFAKGKNLPLTIHYQGAIVGGVTLAITDVWQTKGDLNYWLDADYSDKGIALRSVRAVADYAFRVMQLNRITIRATPDNTASCALAEKLGFALEGMLRQAEWLYDHFNDVNVYAMLRKDWTPVSDGVFEHRIDARLSLRLFERRDASALFALTDANREHIGEWLSWVQYNKNVADTRRFIEQSLERFAREDGFQAGIYEDGVLVGSIGYLYWRFNQKRTEIGYWLSKDATGRGIITRATVALIDYSFDVLEMNRVAIYCATGNVKSCAVPRRLGFHLDGVQRAAEILHDRYVDWNLFSMLRDEWIARREQLT